ncbi:hypothetical protein [Streptomyces sp. NPDC005374]|uniref:hypothetical protein n=1 Tax=Streptomyces sp. NPDC005374 TaxID=3364713 RepID=UPI003678A950
MDVLLAGPPIYAVCLVTTMVMLVAVVAWSIRAALEKCRSEDVPEMLVGLSHVIGALSCFLPWGKWRNAPGTAPDPPALEDKPGAAADVAPTISSTAGQAATPQSPAPGAGTTAGRFPAAGEGGES